MDALRELASARGTSVTQVVNDALKLYAFLGDELAGKSQQQWSTRAPSCVLEGMMDHMEEPPRPAPGEGPPTSTRLGVNVNAETAAALRELAAEHHVSVTEVVRRAVGLYQFVHAETKTKGNELLLVDHEGCASTRLGLL